MRRAFRSIFLVGLVACSAPGNISTGLEQPRSTIPTSSASLATDMYYASIRPDKNAILYYSLAASTATLAGEAGVASGKCRLSIAHVIVRLDEQGMIDVNAVCQSRSAWLQFPAGVTGRVAPTRTIIAPFASDAVIDGDIDRDGNVAVGHIAFSASDPNINTVYLYSPKASENARPERTIHVSTRSCSSSVALGPGPLVGSPRGGIAF